MSRFDNTVTIRNAVAWFWLILGQILGKQAFFFQFSVIGKTQHRVRILLEFMGSLTFFLKDTGVTWEKYLIGASASENISLFVLEVHWQFTTVHVYGYYDSNI